MCPLEIIKVDSEEGHKRKTDKLSGLIMIVGIR